MTHTACDAPAGPIGVLARSQKLDDPEQESLRILLACAFRVSPGRDLAAFVSRAGTVVPQLRAADPTLLTVIAQTMRLTWPGDVECR